MSPQAPLSPCFLHHFHHLRKLSGSSYARAHATCPQTPSHWHILERSRHPKSPDNHLDTSSVGRSSFRTSKVEVELYKLLSLAVLFGVAAVSAFAGGPVIVEDTGPEVVEQGARQMGWLVPLLVIAVVGIAVASGDSDDY